MSWAAHQFEYYAIHGHLTRRTRAQVSFLAIVVGDLSCDLVGKAWVYGYDLAGTHYGPENPAQHHRGWPGEGFSHSLVWAFALAGLVYLITRRNRAWTIGVLIGAAAHTLTDVADSVGTMVLFPFSTRTWSIDAWAYAATPTGRNLDAAAYYSSLGLVMDLLWLGIMLTNWRVLTRDYWRREVVPADAGSWRWMGRRLPERALLTLYRGWFLYGVCRMIAWTSWAHLFESYDVDLRWGGPAWMPGASLSEPAPWLTVGVVAFGVTVVAAAVMTLVRMPDRWFREPQDNTPDGRATRRPARL